MISRIVLTPTDTGMEVKLEGDLAGILNIATTSRSDGGASPANIALKRKNTLEGRLVWSMLRSN